MATLTEDHVAVQVTLTVATDGSKHCFVQGQSYDAANDQLRSMPQTEVTSALTPTQVNEALDLLNAAVAWLKGQWSIP